MEFLSVVESESIGNFLARLWPGSPEPSWRAVESWKTERPLDATSVTAFDDWMSVLVHHLEFSRSLRVLWLLEELGLEYQLKRYTRDANFRAPPELATIHPLGRSPVVETDELVLAESGAIIEYFTEREGRLRPTKPEQLLDYRFFLHYAEGSAMPPLLVQFIMDKLKEVPMPFFVKPIAKKIAAQVETSFSGPAIAQHFAFAEAHLAKHEYFAGEFSAADVQMLYPVEAAFSRGTPSWPQLQRWLALVKSRPAFQRAEKRGGPAIPE